MSGGSVHDPVHGLPLADRLTGDAIRVWLERHAGLALAAAGSGALSDYERGVRAGIEQMRWGRLDDYWYTVVPQVLGELRLAGLLADAVAGDGQVPASPERPVYAKVREEGSTSFFAVTVDEGWRSLILCTGMYEWAADWLLGILGRRPFAAGRR